MGFYITCFCLQSVEDEDRHWNEKPDDEDEFDNMPYSFVPNKQILSGNDKDITLPLVVST